MQVKVLYKYTRPDGGITHSTTIPSGEYLTLYRLIADEGLWLQKDGGIPIKMIDVEDVTGWVEGIVEEIPEEPESTPELTVLISPRDPKTVLINEIDYLDWINFKKRMDTIESNLNTVSESIGVTSNLLNQLENIL